MNSTEGPLGRTRQVVGAFAGFGSVIKKVVLAGLMLACTLVGLVLVCTQRNSKPPRDSVLVEQFRTRRAAFEELNRLLRDDVRLARIGEMGVQTTDSLVSAMPPAADFPRTRYERYLALLKDAGAIAAFRSRDECPEACIAVWAWGWAADTRHVSVCSRCDVPKNQIDSLDDWQPTRSKHVGREFVYRHLEGEWYLREDW